MIVTKKITEYKVETEELVTAAIEEAKNTSSGVVTYKTAYKCKKSRAKETFGDILEEYWVLTITEDYK